MIGATVKGRVAQVSLLSPGVYACAPCMFDGFEVKVLTDLIFRIRLLVARNHAVSIPGPESDLSPQKPRSQKRDLSHPPAMICEGKTDNVYITHAIKKLASNYPTLAALSPTGAASLSVRTFKYPDTSTGRILDLHGGTGDLKSFIRQYYEDINKFKVPGLSQPVIILIDNDSSKKDICSVIYAASLRT
jgi:hypothetical protein